MIRTNQNLSKLEDPTLIDEDGYVARTQLSIMRVEARLVSHGEALSRLSVVRESMSCSIYLYSSILRVRSVRHSRLRRPNLIEL